MCAIAGIVSTGRLVNTQAVSAMNALMAHRGPDGEGLWQSPDGRIVLGHRRLAIIDPSPASAQPITAPGLALTYNGELYNYLELRAELQSLGASFATTGDAEILLQAWRVWGPDCVRRFNGMFAFALWDEERRLLFCARDRFGEKPFLYTLGDGWLGFASEYKALLTLTGVSSHVDAPRLARFLSVPADGLDRGDETLFPAIRQLAPAHWMMVSLDDLTIQSGRYWDGAPDSAAATLGMTEAAERFHWLLNDSIRLRMRSDVELGSCLSGGLDSGAIACLVRRQLGPESVYHTFSGRFPGAPSDEKPFMDMLSAASRSTCHEVSPDPAELADELADFAWANELPVDSASQYAQYCVFRLARRTGVTVLLDGQGADEILGGYEQYFAAYLAGSDKAERDAVTARYPGALDHVSPWHGRLPPALRRHLAHALKRGSDLAFGLHRDLVIPLRSPTRFSLHDMLRRDSLDGFLGTLLRYGDRNSMAHSIEVRLPFTDHRLFEFAQGLAPALLMGDAQTKRLLRESMRGILPEAVRTRWRKQGFLPPQVTWLRGGLDRHVEEAIEAEDLSPIWDRGWWRQALTRFRSGDDSLASGLWKVLATEAWRRHFVERIRAMPTVSAIQ